MLRRCVVVSVLSLIASSVGITPLGAQETTGSVQPAKRDVVEGGKEKVTGIGGLFFRAKDPKALSQWYLTHLGINLTPTSYGESPWRQEAGPTVFSPFAKTTKHFGRPQQAFMVNPNGRFARIHDPEGNPIELWEPKR